MELKTACTIILDPDDTHMIDTIVRALEATGFSIENIIRAEGIIEACGNSQSVQELKDHHVYAYVREICTFVSDDTAVEQFDGDD